MIPEAAYPGTPSGATWTTERVEQLRSYVVAGLTCSQIAAEIGVTRNSVIGKIHRLGLTPMRRPGQRSTATLAQRMGAAMQAPPKSLPRPQSRITRIFRAIAAAPPVVPASAEHDALVESPRRCALLALTSGQCRWPLSDPGKADFGFCGNDAINGFSYCAGHARIAYRLPSGRRA